MRFCVVRECWNKPQKHGYCVTHYKCWSETNPAPTASAAFHAHKDNAKRRGIPFLLTFEQWWGYWWPYWHLRGIRGDQYCMARFGDVGAYEVGNVEIITARANRLLQKRK